MSEAPIALFVYNRPWHTRQTVESLQKNESAEQSDLFIFSDAPKNPEASSAVQEVREYIRGIGGFKSVTIIEREENLGLANSIIDGVTRLCNDYGRVIVLEDDLVVSPYFLGYMNEALEQYQNDDRVMQISAHMFPVNITSETDAVFLPMTTSWGWATWKRSWQRFDRAATGYEEIRRNAALLKQFNLGGSYKYSGMMERQLRGEIDSWAVRWHLSVFLQSGLTLFPIRTLVKNMGFDGSGTHCKASYHSDLLSHGFKVRSYPVAAVNEEAKQAVYTYLAKNTGRVNRVWHRMSGWLARKIPINVSSRLKK
jgi:hypothetical protein